MGYAKVKKKIWTHEGPSTKKNDEHKKAHELKERDSHVLKIKTRERSFI
jgi:hypothetical protein